MTKPSGCRDCPLYTKGIGFVPDHIAPDAEYVFQGEAPGANEVDQAKPFVGKAGFVLKEWLVKAVPTLRIAMEKNRISFTNTLRCLPPEVGGRPYPRGAEKDQAEQCCRQYDTPTTAQTFILFGENAQRLYFGKELDEEDQSDRRLGRDVKGVMGRIGRVYESDGSRDATPGRRYIFAPHPAYILRQPALVEHGQQSLHIAAGTEKVITPAYLPWSEAIKELNG